MSRQTILPSPLRMFRNLAIGWKLTLTIIGAVGMLAGVAWFALDRLVAVGALQDGVGQQAAMERQVQRGMVAALDLRVVNRELQHQQTVLAVKQVAARAEQSAATARDLLTEAQQATIDTEDRALLTQAMARLEDTVSAIQRETVLRTEMLTARQKRLFQVRQLFENSQRTFAAEIAQGGSMLGGAASVRASGEHAIADKNDPTFEAFNNYRLAMGRVQEAAIMFLATGNGSAANEVRDAIKDAATAMDQVLNGDAPDPLKASARTVQTIGNGVAQTALDLIAQTRRLDDIAQNEVETACQAMQKAIADLAQLVADRVRAASDHASEARATALRDMFMLIAGIAVLMLGIGALVTQLIAAPLRGLTKAVQAIATGETATVVAYRGQLDEIGRMAVAVETLRDVMQKAFVQSQMIDQIPVPVMTADAANDFRITYLNPEARRVLDLVKQYLPVTPEQILGAPLDIFYPDGIRERAVLTDPANLPRRTRITMGPETLESCASAIHDRHGAFVGPMITWNVLTAQTRLVAQFEHSVGAIAAAVAKSADAMKQAAVTLNEAVDESGQRIEAVTVASEQASVHVSTAAAGAEELAVSVTEIGRHVAESSHIAGQAVRDAEATDQCVSGLSDAAGRIGDVVRLISDIASRTNLLALNATIEAARAGEAGKGFAVVASEVKVLATQTAKATQEIGAQITAMQDATGVAVGALRSIGGTIQRMNEIATTIAAAVEEQGAATKEIARAAQQAATDTSQVNDNITVVSHSVDNTGIQSTVVLRAATLLSEQSVTLRTEVRSFLSAVQEAA